MKSAGLSEREKLMLPTAFAIIAIVMYAAFRWKPANAAVTELQAQLQVAIDGRSNLKFPTSQNRSPEQLKAELESLQSDLETTQQRLGQARATLVDLEEGTALQDLKIQISTLAQESRVTIVESVPEEHGKTTSRQGRQYLNQHFALDPENKASAPLAHEAFQHLYERPWQRLSMRSSFIGLLTFARGLEALDWRVTLVGFSIKALNSADQFESPELDATFVLAL